MPGDLEGRPPPPPPATSPGPQHERRRVPHTVTVAVTTNIRSVATLTCGQWCVTLTLFQLIKGLPRLAVPVSNACYFMHRCQMIDCQHQVQPFRTVSKITITATSALILGMTHLITFPLSSSLSHGVVNDHFRYILAILLKQSGLNTGRFWNVFSDSPLLTRSDLKLHTIKQINHLYMFSNSNTQQHSQANAFQHWHIDQYWMTGCWSRVTVQLESVGCCMEIFVKFTATSGSVSACCSLATSTV